MKLVNDIGQKTGDKFLKLFIVMRSNLVDKTMETQEKVGLIKDCT